jgi:hypothetical protein
LADISSRIEVNFKVASNGLAPVPGLQRVAAMPLDALELTTDQLATGSNQSTYEAVPVAITHSALTSPLDVVPRS